MPVPYVAVEHLLGDVPYTFASDIWSLGITMWEMSLYCLRSRGTVYYKEINGNIGPKQLLKFLAPKVAAKFGKNEIIQEEDYAHKPSNRLNLRKDMPMSIKKLILSTWDIKSKRPTAEQVEDQLKEIEQSPKSHHFLELKISRGDQAVEPNSDPFLECCVVL